MAELEPHIVTKAVKPPGKCIASGDTEGPFIDTARTVGAPGQVYVSVRWLESVATDLLGMVPESEVEARFEESDRLLKEQGERLEALQRVADAAQEYEGAREALAGAGASGGDS